MAHDGALILQVIAGIVDNLALRCDICCAMVTFHIGDVIRKRRDALGMTQAQLAAKISMRQATLSDIESTGVCRTPTLETIARGLGITAADIYADVPQPAPGAAAEPVTCELHKDLHVKLEGILHGAEFWSRGIESNILALYAVSTAEPAPPSERDNAPVYRRGDRIRITRR